MTDWHWGNSEHIVKTSQAAGFLLRFWTVRGFEQCTLFFPMTLISHQLSVQKPITDHPPLRNLIWQSHRLILRPHDRNATYCFLNSNVGGKKHSVLVILYSYISRQLLSSTQVSTSDFLTFLSQLKACKNPAITTTEQNQKNILTFYSFRQPWIVFATIDFWENLFHFCHSKDMLTGRTKHGLETQFSIHVASQERGRPHAHV